MLNVFARKTNLRLVIAGTGPMKDYVEGFTKDNDNIHYVGFKSGKDLDDLIMNSFFIIVPSEWYENNPMVIIEAYSFGKPVIGTDIGGIPELVKHGENGFLFERGNQWSLDSVIDKAAILEEDEYYKLSNTAINFARQNFNNGDYYHRLNKTYNDIINNTNFTKT
jgi:glycosyltransferase involved in cell wall biosynthesis